MRRGGKAPIIRTSQRHVSAALPTEMHQWSRMISVTVVAMGGGYSGHPNLVFADERVCNIVHCTQFKVNVK